MYVTDENIETLNELHAFVGGALESAEDEEYWQGLSSRTFDVLNKMIDQRNRQKFKQEVQKSLRKLKKDFNPSLD